MFPACCFCQRTYVAQGLFNEILNETWTHSCFQYKLPLVGQTGLYRGRCFSFLECVYFGESVCAYAHACELQYEITQMSGLFGLVVGLVV